VGPWAVIKDSCVLFLSACWCWGWVQKELTLTLHIVLCEGFFFPPGSVDQNSDHGRAQHDTTNLERDITHHPLPGLVHGPWAQTQRFMRWCLPKGPNTFRPGWNLQGNATV
jgi:hypothetical protein